jgi:hypothetical protein
MTVFTIWLRRISTGETAPSMVTRQASEAAARDYAEKALKDANETDLEVHEVRAR